MTPSSAGRALHTAHGPRPPQLSLGLSVSLALCALMGPGLSEWVTPAVSGGGVALAHSVEGGVRAHRPAPLRSPLRLRFPSASAPGFEPGPPLGLRGPGAGFGRVAVRFCLFPLALAVGSEFQEQGKEIGAGAPC